MASFPFIVETGGSCAESHPKVSVDLSWMSPQVYSQGRSGFSAFALGPSQHVLYHLWPQPPLSTLGDFPCWFGLCQVRQALLPHCTAFYGYHVASPHFLRWIAGGLPGTLLRKP